MESYNAVLINKGMEQKERTVALRRLARTQLLSLQNLKASIEQKNKQGSIDNV